MCTECVSLSSGGGAGRGARPGAGGVGGGRAPEGATLAAGRRLDPDAKIDENVKSVASLDTRKVEFLNARESTSAIYWVDFKGVEVHYVDLPPGMTTVLSSFANHVWVARDMASNAAISMYTVAPWTAGDAAVQHLIITVRRSLCGVVVHVHRRVDRVLQFNRC